MSKEALEKAKKYTFFSFTGYTQKEYQPFYIEKAEGIRVWDDNGKEYIDLGSQLVNVNIGHGNKAVIKAVQEQVEALSYVAPKHAFDRRGELGELIIEELAPKNAWQRFSSLLVVLMQMSLLSDLRRHIQEEIRSFQSMNPITVEPMEHHVLQVSLTGLHFSQQSQAL